MIKIIDRIVLVGTSHVAENSISEIKEALDKYMPEVVGIELDTNRFKALMSENAQDKKKARNDYAVIRELGVFGYLFTRVAGYVQKKVGAKIGVEPGLDMKAAYTLSRERKIPVSLIDINIKTTMKKMSSLGLFKKLGLFVGILKPASKEEKELLNFDLKSVPDDEVVVRMIEVLRKKTPPLYKILIDDRNVYMANRLLKLREDHSGFIVAVVGAGHVEGMAEILNKHIYSFRDGMVSYSFIAQVEGD